jgi:hypothetical protein
MAGLDWAPPQTQRALKQTYALPAPCLLGRQRLRSHQRVLCVRVKQQ